MINIYCVIQEVKSSKRDNEPRVRKELEVYSSNYSDHKIYGYSYAGEYFQREKKPSYKVSIHKSYREKGVIKKKQWAICTMSYYDMVDFGADVQGCINSKRLKAKIEDMRISEDEFYRMVYDKLDPIYEAIMKEYKVTEEYKTHKKHQDIIRKYIDDKKAFESKYGSNTYDYCYDVYGVLREPDMLKEIKRQYENSQKYYSSYYENFKSNYSNSNFSSYFNTKASTYTEEEKETLKIIYRTAAKRLHPDVNKDNGEGMKLLNKLKEEWGI